MALVTYLRKLPQQYALTGRRSPTSISEQYGIRSRSIGVPKLATLASMKPSSVTPTTTLADMVPTKKQKFEQIGGGPGVGEAPAPTTDPNSLGAVMGQDLASSMLGSGFSGMLPTGLAAYSLNAPLSVAVPAVAQSATRSMFAPFHLVNTIGGTLVAGQNAGEQGEIAEAMTGSEDIGKALSVAAYKAQPHTLTSIAKNAVKSTLGLGTPGNSDLSGQLGLGMATVSKGAQDPFAQTSSISSALKSYLNQKVSEPSKSSLSVADVSIPGVENLGPIGPALSQAINQETASLMNSPLNAPEVSTTITGPQPNSAVVGGGIQGVSPTGQSGLGSMGQAPTGQVGGAAAPSPGMGGGGGGGGLTGMSGGANSPTGQGAGEGTGGDSGGSSGGTLLCSELHRQGILSDHIYRADSRYGQKLDAEVMSGYHFIAKPLVSIMQKSRVFTWLIKWPVISFARQAAYREKVLPAPNLIGSAIEKIGIPLCRLISNLRSLHGQTRLAVQGE